MQGTYTTRHYQSESGTCPDCGKDIFVGWRTDWDAHMPEDSGGRASGIVEEDTVSTRSIAGRLLGILPKDVTIRDAVVTRQGVTLSVTVGGVLVDAILIQTRTRSIVDPEECSFVTEVCEHSYRIGQYCYYCPDHLAQDTVANVAAE